MEFVIGSKPVRHFRMIGASVEGNSAASRRRGTISKVCIAERHYFRDRLLKSFDFDFGFCIPNSVNTCEHIYHLPHLSESLVEEMINNPFETRSDSFYFIEDKLVTPFPNPTNTQQRHQCLR